MSNTPATVVLNGTKGKAITGGGDVTIQLRDGSQELWPSTRDKATSMDNALREIVETLDDGVPFPCPAEIGARALEAIIGFHTSHDQNAAWVELPLTGADREREVRFG